MIKRLRRSESEKMIGGVCGGVADYFKIDPVLVRGLFLIAIFGYGTGLLAYIVLWILMPVQKKNPNFNSNYNPEFEAQSQSQEHYQEQYQESNANSANSQNSDYSSSYSADSSYENQNFSHEAEQVYHPSHKTIKAENGTLKKYFAITLILIGFLILIEEYLPEFSFEWGFPALLIGLGTVILIKARNQRSDNENI